MNHTKGIHHITAVAGDPAQNLAFYRDILGMRLVKKTVNFDDPSVYHLYYGDETGQPGSILTFFPWSHLSPGDPGTGQVVAIGFAVPEGATGYWAEHLARHDVDTVAPFERFGKTVLGLQDPDGLHLELVEDPRAGELPGWEGGPADAPHAIRGFHGATLAETDYRPTGALLENFLGFAHTDEEHDRHLYTTDAPLGSAIEVIDGSELRGRPGKGTVHHIAFRAESPEEQAAIRRDLIEAGYHVTERKDRCYFQSVYFHEAGGVLCEIATDGPGFAVDEAEEHLGGELKLPEWLENRRDLIEAELPELH